MVERSNRSATTTCAASSAGRITRCTRSARAARNRNNSATGDISCGNLSATLRTASATGVPPGWRTAIAGRPSATSRAASQRTRVDFPAPSGPSTTMKTPSAQRDDGARRPLLHTLVDPRVHLGHELLEISLRGHDLLIHRIRLDALERTVVFLHLIFGGLAPLLCRPLDILGDTLDLGEQLPTGCVFLHPLTGPQQRLVLFALSQQPPQLARLLVDHVPPSSSMPASRKRGRPNRSSYSATRDQSYRRASART